MAAGAAHREFSPQYLHEILSSLPTPAVYWVAYSGGCDSNVLLHAMATLAPRLNGSEVRAIHVDHGLHPDSATWAQHCVGTCRELGIDCIVETVRVDRGSGVGLEAAARSARYAALRRHVVENHILLTAHHRDDQAETVLLQLLRGGGAHGLAAMPLLATFGAGRLARPLLSVARSDIKKYAQHHDLYWVEDPSNFDTTLGRNFVRHDIMPRLEIRWPEAGAILARGAARFAEIADLIDTLAHQDLRRLVDAKSAGLHIDKLLQLPHNRRKNAIRGWLRKAGIRSPSPDIYERLEPELLRAGPDAAPILAWRGGQFRRYRDRLFVFTSLPDAPEAFCERWPLVGKFALPPGLGFLRVVKRPGRGLSRAVAGRSDVTVRFRRGGEHIVPVGRGHKHSLKKLFQEHGVAPWWRERMPLVYVGDSLAAVPGVCVAAKYAAAQDEQGLWVEWRR